MFWRCLKHGVSLKLWKFRGSLFIKLSSCGFFIDVRLFEICWFFYSEFLPCWRLMLQSISRRNSWAIVICSVLSVVWSTVYQALFYHILLGASAVAAIIISFLPFIFSWVTEWNSEPWLQAGIITNLAQFLDHLANPWGKEHWSFCADFVIPVPWIDCFDLLLKCCARFSVKSFLRLVIIYSLHNTQIKLFHWHFDCYAESRAD